LFNSTAAHTKHRVGPYAPINKPETRRCLTPAEMTAKGMVRNALGLWVTAAMPSTKRSPASMARHFARLP
jgi:hypothetical protein